MHKLKKIGGYSYVEFFELDHSILYANWCGYINVEQAKEGCEMMLELVKKYNFNSMLSDNRLILGSWTQSIGWLGENFMPRLVASGIKRIAFVYSKEEAAKYSVNRLLEVNDEYEGQAFDSYNDAFNWISGLVEINLENVYLTLTSKSNESIKIIINNILYITSMDNLITIHTKENNFESCLTLKKIIDLLPQPQFYRVHKSYIVNIHYINKIKYHAGGTYRLNLDYLGNVFIPVGRVYASDLKLILKNKYK